MLGITMSTLILLLHALDYHLQYQVSNSNNSNQVLHFMQYKHVDNENNDLLWFVSSHILHTNKYLSVLDLLEIADCSYM